MSRGRRLKKGSEGQSSLGLGAGQGSAWGGSQGLVAQIQPGAKGSDKLKLRSEIKGLGLSLVQQSKVQT